MSRYSLRTGQRTKHRLRVIAIAVSAVSTVMFLILVVLFNLSEKEEGYATGIMAFRHVTVTQDSTPALRGSIHQKVLGVTVETFGKGTPIQLQRLVFRVLGPMSVNLKNIENARVWYTGKDPEFSPQEMIGSTIMSLDDEPLVFQTSQELLQGKNHFWLTFDVKGDALVPNAWIDASCLELVVGGIRQVPNVTSPDGRRWIQNNVPYYSMGNLSLNKVASWNSRRDGSGVHPRQLSETRNSFFIQSGHRMISSTGGNLQTLVVERGGELKITSPLRLNALHVAFGGKLQVDAVDTGAFMINDFTMENGATYFHNCPGELPAYRCDFVPGSYQVFFNYSEKTFNRLIEFGTVIIDAQNAEETVIHPEYLRVKGDLEFRKTGSGWVSFASGETSVDGDLVLSGGSFRFGKEGNVQVEIGGDLKVFSGRMSDCHGSAHSRLDVCGDVILLGGQIDLSHSGNSELNLCGPTLTRWIQRDSCRIILGNVTIMPKHVLVWKGSGIGPVSDNAEWRVESGAELHCGSAVLEGKGDFILDDLAVLGIGHSEGIYSFGKKGNIQTTGRQYHSGAIYRFDGLAQPQATGEFKTDPRQKTVRRLIVNKPSSAPVLHLSQDLIVDELCRVQSGDLRQNGFSLTLPDGRLAGSK